MSSLFRPTSINIVRNHCANADNHSDRRHSSDVISAKSAKVKLLQQAGQSCATCPHFTRIKFSTVCAVKHNKPMNPYNICELHTHTPTPTLTPTSASTVESTGESTHVSPL